jgi:two-component system LytT family response regulator
VQIVGEAGDGRSAVAEIARTSPDLVLLDVQMPELDGFEVVENLPRDHLPAMIFVTAYDRYALQAFDVHAIDYLLKPFTPERFRTALDRARDRVRRRDHDIGVDRIDALEPATHGDFDVRLRDGTRLTLSRTFRLRLEQVLGHPL